MGTGDWMSLHHLLLMGAENTAVINQLKCVPFESSLSSNAYCVKW